MNIGNIVSAVSSFTDTCISNTESAIESIRDIDCQLVQTKLEMALDPYKPPHILGKLVVKCISAIGLSYGESLFGDIKASPYVTLKIGSGVWVGPQVRF
jgi:hypothetical protein